MIHAKNHSISGVFVFLLLGVFAVFGTLLVLLGTHAYRATMERTALHNDTRIIETFVRHAVRAQDMDGNIEVEYYDGIPVLAIGKAGDYVSYIYVYEGMLYELYTEDAFEAGSGEEICNASGFGAIIDRNVLRIMIFADSGAVHVINTALRCYQ